MSAFGQTLFGGSQFVRWTLSPLVILFALLMPFLVEGWTLTRVVVFAGIEFLCLALLVGFWLPVRVGRWAFRCVCGGVFLAYAVYVMNQLLFSDAPFRLFESRAVTSPRNAVLGLVIIGLPSLWYALFGRFTRRKPVPGSEIVKADAAET